MFSVLHLGSIVYILDKSSGHMTLKTGVVQTTSNLYSPYLQNLNIDISVKADLESLEFKQLPGAFGIATYNNIIIADSKDLIINEVESLIKLSLKIIESIPELEAIISSGEDILKLLSPQFAQLKDLEDKINNLENKVGGIEVKLDDIYNILTKISNK